MLAGRKREGISQQERRRELIRVNSIWNVVMPDVILSRALFKSRVLFKCKIVKLPMKFTFRYTDLYW